ncbi:MAG: hypothetical protein ACK5NT_09330 [Pyrinomonadaceae bacterium]
MKVLFVAAILFTSLFCGCETGSKPADTASKGQTTSTRTPQPDATTSIPSYVDVPELANKTSRDFEKVYGKARKVTVITDELKLMPGEYREYTVEGNPKGLSVRFHNDKAKRFNLLLGTATDNAEDALLQTFRIDVSKLEKIQVDPLSETWKGREGGLNFETVYAKRDATGGKFVMLHAEIK